MIRLFFIYYCKSRMVAYVNGELPTPVRRRMARYIDKYPECYAEYRRQRQMRSELTERLPIFGVPQGGQLQRLWQTIEGEATKPAVYIISLAQALRLTALVLLFMWISTTIATRNILGDDLIIITPPTPDNTVITTQNNNAHLTPDAGVPTLVAIGTLSGIVVLTERDNGLIAQPTQGASYQNPYPTPKIGE